MESLYREHLMDHYKHPRNHGKLKNPDIHHKGFNPLCGDHIDIFIQFKDNKATVHFEGKGCAISQAAASMLTELADGKTKAQLKRITKEDVFEALGIRLSPSRVKCALLAWDTLQEGMQNGRS